MRRAEDEPDARFYAAGGRSAQQTLAHARDNVTRLVASLAEHGRRQPPITPERLLKWHGAIFGQLFSEDAGRWRREYERVAFPVSLEEAGQVRRVIVHGAPAPLIPERVASACSRLREALDTAEAPAAAVGGAALAAFMSDLLRIHPFVDGNHRIALVAAQAVFIRLTGQPVLWGDDYRPLEEALELAIIADEDRRSLASLLTRRLERREA